MKGREVVWAAAAGYGGQHLFFVFVLELAAVVTAGYYGEPMQLWLPFVIFNRYVLRAVKQS